MPEHPNPPTPSCPKNYGWESSRQCCTPSKTTPTPTPKPSSKPGSPSKGNGGHYYKNKRNAQNWDQSFCPSGLVACPIKVNNVLTGDSEWCVLLAPQLWVS